MNGNDIAQIRDSAAQYAEFLDQFKDMFVGRGRALEFVKYALLTRQHMLLFGPPGTSKTAVCDRVFEGITGANTFATELTAFMTEDGIFGPYDVKLLREQGVLKHRIEGMLPEADFARFGEFLDANAQTLRSLLGAMNERRMMRGAQQLKLPLKTVYCDTNKDPADYIRRNPDAFAVLDRIMFIDRLDYLDKADDVGEMVKRFQRGKTTQLKHTIPAEVIEKLSRFIVLPPGLISDPSIMDTYAVIASEYRAARRAMSDEERKHFILPDISDRRICYASQILEAEAVLHGRVAADVEDITAAGLVLCNSDAERKLWNDIAAKHIAEHKKNSASQTTTAQGLAIKGILDQLVQKVLNAPTGTPPKEVGHTLQVLAKQLADIAPKDPDVQALHEKAKLQFADALKQVQQRALAEGGIAHLQF